MVSNKVGVAFFDTVTRAVSGHKYLDGKLELFESIGELDNGVIWITNVPYSAFKEQQLWSYPNLRDEQYARLSITQLIREVGGRSRKDLGVLETVGYLVTKALYKLCEQFPIDLSLENYRVSKALAPHIIPHIYQSFPSGIDINCIEACTNAFKALQGAHKSKQTKAQLLYFTFPRPNFYAYLLNQSFPLSNDWKHVQFTERMTIGNADGESLPNSDAVVNKLKKMHVTDALLLKVNVRKIDKRYMQGFNFSNVGMSKNVKPRVWATLPEIIDLSRYCHIEIIEGYKTAGGPLDIRPELDLSAIRYDYSQGITAENIFNALVEKVGFQNRDVYTGLSAYLKAYDRLVCGKLAEAFMKEGFLLGGFGMAGVRVWAPKDKESELKEIASNYGAYMDVGVSDD